MEKIIHVQGMMCSACEKRVEQALQKCSGVTMVHADAKAGQVMLSYDATQVAFQALKQTIEDVGYDVVEERIA